MICNKLTANAQNKLRLNLVQIYDQNKPYDFGQFVQKQYAHLLTHIKVYRSL